MILNETAHVNGMPNGVKKQANGHPEPGSHYWGKRYVPNEGETFEVGPYSFTVERTGG